MMIVQWEEKLHGNDRDAVSGELSSGSTIILGNYLQGVCFGNVE
jgi:hypothetical protein